MRYFEKMVPWQGYYSICIPALEVAITKWFSKKLCYNINCFCCIQLVLEECIMICNKLFWKLVPLSGYTSISNIALELLFSTKCLWVIRRGSCTHGHFIRTLLNETSASYLIWPQVYDSVYNMALKWDFLAFNGAVYTLIVTSYVKR